MAATSGKARRKRRKPASSAKSRGLWPWVAALVVIGGGIAISENMQSVKRWLPASLNFQPSQSATHSAPKHNAGPIPPANIPAPAAKPAGELAKVLPTADLVGKSFTATFYFCGTSGLDNCVVDGGTFWFRKQQIRLADVSAPRTENAACPQERSKGFAAKVRLRDLLNAGAFELTDWPNKNEDASGRQLRVVMRNGSSLGQQLVREGVVHRATEASNPWC